MGYKYLERYTHFHVFSSSQFEFPLHSTERPGKSPDAFTALHSRNLSRVISVVHFEEPKNGQISAR